MTIKAIETVYAGCTFRSRLEARWAVFFDEIEIPWRYEAQGFEMPDGTRCLPDFWLPQQNLWYEVKGIQPADNDPWFSFARWLEDARTVLSWGDIPDPRKVNEVGPYKVYDVHDIIIRSPFGGDEGYAWTCCSECGSFDVQFEARGERNYCDCDIPNKSRWGNHPDIIFAYYTARSARFEHDQREDW